MKKNNQWFAILISLLAIVLTGCVSGTQTQKGEADSKSVRKQCRGQNMVVAVDVVSDGKSADVVDQLSSAIVSKLRSKNVFKRVLSKSATLEKHFDMVVSVTPKSYQHRDIAQYWLVFFGGRSAIAMQVMLIDGNTGQTIAEGTIEAKAPMKITTFTATSMALAIDLAAEEVANFTIDNIK